MKTVLSALSAGLLFGIGLVVSGMTRPEKVQGFLDFTGSWDPSLAFVMAGGIAVHLPLARLIRRRQKPLCETCFDAPSKTTLDRRLLIGSAIFGAGWGLGGVCPGPGLVSAAGGAGGIAAFVATMLVGMALFEVTLGSRRAGARQPAAAPDA